MKFQAATHHPVQTLVVHHEDETSQLSHSSGEVPSSTSKNGDLPKATGSLGRKSSCHKGSPPLKECHGSHDKDSHSSSSKHQDKSHKDKEDSKSPHKHMASPVQRSSTVWAEKEPWLKEPPMIFHTSSRSHHLSQFDEQLSFSCLTSASTPSKTTGGPCPPSVFSDSRCSMTPFETGLGGSFSIPGSIGICCGSLTPATSVSRLQPITSSGWHEAMPLSPLTLQGLDPLNVEQTAGIYQLATECQTLGSELAKWFQTLCGLEASHHTAAQATAHEIVLSGCQAHSTAYGVAASTQQAEPWELTLHRLCEEANKAWKGANDVIFSHLLKYDSELANFLNSAEEALRNKCDEIWGCVQSLVEATNCSPQTGLSLAL